MKKFSRSLKTVGVITLFFFSWSYLPLFQFVAYAASQDKQTIKAQTQKTGKQQPAAKLEKLLDDLKADTSKAEGKAAKGEDTSSEVQSIKARKAEVDTIDSDLKKEFADTEQKLKSANLPKEILSRHYKFVQNYETNLAELKANIDAIEKAKTPSALTSELAKTKKQLAKIKPPKKRKPFDPNKLPNRLVKGKARQPRLKKEEFKKDFPPQKIKKAQGDTANFIVAADDGHTRTNNKPVILAYNGPASDLPILTASTDLPAFQVAQAGTTAEPADLAETPDIQFTPEIKAKAQELEYKPLKIYEWVRNNIEYAPTYGSIQGANICLQSKICNDIDTASLLIALLRASNISAHYVYGTIELPIDKAENWVGGVTDPNMVGTILATNGVPAKVLVSGGTIKAVQLEHVWVSTWINYIPSRGAVHRPGHEDTWIPLDASFKQYNYTSGIDLASAVPFDAQSFSNQLLSTATTNTANGSVTNVDSTFVQQTMQNYQTQVQNYIQQNSPNATVGDVIGKKEIIQKNYPILLGTLPYKTVQVGATFAQVPDNLRETLSFSVPDPTGANAGLTYSTGMPQIAGKKITLSFSPATAADQAVIASYAFESGSISSLPAYLINLTPELRIDGQVVATGSSITMGTELPFTISLNEPGIGPSQVNNNVLAGEYFGIGLDSGGMASIDTLKAKLEATKTKLEAQNLDSLTKDDIVGDLLYAAIASYFIDLDTNDEITARSKDVVRYRAPSIGMASLKLDVSGIFNIPTNADSKGIMIDIDRIMQCAFSKDGNMDNVIQYMLSSGMYSSILEHTVPERLYSQPSAPVNALSAAKALKLANDQGIPIYMINQSNISAILPELQISSEVKSDISNAVNAGKVVTIPKSSILYNGWTGNGYIIIDPVTGAGAYMISSGTSGAWAILGAVSGILAGMGIVLIGAFITTGLPLVVGLLGAILLGLGIGLMLSQILSQDAKNQLRQITTMALEKAMPMFRVLGFSNPTMWILLIAWIIMKFVMPLFGQSGMMFYRNKKLLYLVYSRSLPMEA